MLDGFEAATVQTGETEIFVRRGGSGPPILLLHGFPQFAVGGHDRGGRVAHRLALDHPDRVERLAVLDIVPTAEAWGRADARVALAYWPWSLPAQPAPLPERLLAAAPEAVVGAALGGWGSPCRPSARRSGRPTRRRCATPSARTPS